MYQTCSKYFNRSLSILLISSGLAYGYSSNPADYKITQLNERIDGLTTIIEGLSVSLNELRYEQKKVTSLEEKLARQDALIEKLTLMVDDIHNNYVSKELLQKELASYSEKTKKITKKTEKKNFKGKENATLYSEGVRHFGKQRYEEAKRRFIITEKNKYKPAASNFYLGEIAYYTKNYEDAIYHFKKSAGLYDQASYIDTLLFHTAVSLEKTGDKKQARLFYENIIENYPTKKTAKISKKRLKNL